MPSRAELVEYQQAQIALVQLASDELRTFWDGLDMWDGPGTKAALQGFLPTLTAEFGAAAAAMAADWFDDLRSRERTSSRFAAELAAVLPAEQIRNQVGYAASVHLFTDHPEQMLVALLDDIGKDVLQPGRDTIVTSTNRDPDAVGWHRETRPSRSYASGCGFCQMLEGRGGVYKRSTARFASHGSCKCVAYPSWDEDAAEVPVETYVASARRLTGQDRQRVYDWVGPGPERSRF